MYPVFTYPVLSLFCQKIDIFGGAASIVQPNMLGWHSVDSWGKRDSNVEMA